MNNSPNTASFSISTLHKCQEKAFYHYHSMTSISLMRTNTTLYLAAILVNRIT